MFPAPDAPLHNDLHCEALPRTRGQRAVGKTTKAVHRATTRIPVRTIDRVHAVTFDTEI